ncbi:MAG: histidine--tRNA ligase [Kofleriaceae bacterium]
MNDLLPPDSSKWQHLERTCREVFARFGYLEARPPVVEHTELFVRGVGEGSDIVGKEMYTFKDRSDRSLTLRPEFTAGLARAYIEHAMATKEAVTRWWSIGPVFRYEAVNTGRYRQFFQIDCEAYGVGEPTLDAELIGMLHALYAALGVAPVTALINNVGHGDDRGRYREALVAFVTPKADGLCGDCKRRLVTNPLRILDCKVATCQALMADAPSILDHLGDAARAHFATVQATLTALGVPFVVEPRLVRGLDYYTGTVFEFTTTAGNLGSQSTLVAGGRYDDMIAELGGPRTPAIGFGIGVERTVLCMPGDAASYAPAIDLFIAAMGPAGRVKATALAHQLRLAGVTVEVEHREVGFKAQFRRADKLAARLTLALGESELATGAAKLKVMADRSETAIRLDDLAAAVATALAAR